jgi:hypothetical protein
MLPLEIALLVFACVFGGALVGMFSSAALPEHHLSKDSVDSIKMGMGLVATMTALVLGLVTASAKSAFDSQAASVEQTASDILALDRVLASYGPETQEIRESIKRVLASRMTQIWPEDGSGSRRDAPEALATAEGIQRSLLALSPKGDAQSWLKSRALDLASDVLQTRWRSLASGSNVVQTPFLVVVVSWLTVIFWSFGLVAPRNATVIAVLLVCALSVSASIFLILEMGNPYEGLMRVSSAPLKFTLDHLGK